MANRSVTQQLRVGIYARISTLNHGQDPALQTTELREYCDRRSWQVVGEYVDVGISGSTDRRPELDRLLVDARRRRVDIILVWKLDRFSRSLRNLVNSLAELDTLGVDFVSFRDNLDFSTPSGRLMFQIIGAMAEFERALIQERVRAGMRNARAKGRRIGRPPQTQLSSELRSDIANAYQCGGTSLRLLAKTFGTSLATVQRCVHVSRMRVIEEFPSPEQNGLEPPTR
jgi:DNA invertase Pin-like site-specific DNA recombinase